MNLYSTMSVRIQHIKRKDNIAPEVPYTDVLEFLTMQREFVQGYSGLIADILKKAFIDSQTSTAFEWTERDQIINGMAYFPQLLVEGKDLVMTLTKQKGETWCTEISVLMSNYVTTACRTHARAHMQWPVGPWTNFDDMYLKGMQQEMITTMYESLRLFDLVYNQSFVDIWTDDHIVSHTFTAEKWREMQLALAMGTHDRLGKNSAVYQQGIMSTDMLAFVVELATLCQAAGTMTTLHAVFV